MTGAASPALRCGLTVYLATSAPDAIPLAPVLPHGMPDPSSVPGERDVVIREDPAHANECRWS